MFIFWVVAVVWGARNNNQQACEVARRDSAPR